MAAPWLRHAAAEDYLLYESRRSDLRCRLLLRLGRVSGEMRMSVLATETDLSDARFLPMSAIGT